jgi:hypothetical protein
MTTYAEHMARIAESADAMYAAEAAVKATAKGTDAYMEARLTAANARHAYDAAYAAKMGAATDTVRNAS